MRLPLKAKLTLILTISIITGALTSVIASAWAFQLYQHFGPFLSWTIVIAIAILPGFSYWLFFTGLLLDNRPQYERQETLPDLTILIAMYNEENDIEGTIDSLHLQEYPGNITIVTIDDGSTDETLAAVQRSIDKYFDTPGFVIKVGSLKENQGKAAALNEGLKIVETEFFITIDADTYLYKDAIRHLVTNIVCGPENTAAVAGSILVRNSRETLITKIQEWDYFHGISVIKRIQSMFQGTLVAQGAFSVYNTEAVQELGGWDTSTVGEDIVLTWGLRGKGYCVGYAENAFSLTNVPTTYGTFLKQRIRWSRGH